MESVPLDSAPTPFQDGASQPDIVPPESEPATPISGQPEGLPEIPQTQKVGAEAGALAVGYTREEADEPHSVDGPPADIPPKQPVDRSGKKPKGAIKKPKGGTGHFSKHLKTQLAQSGKLNATPPMSDAQRRARRKKRKRK